MVQIHELQPKHRSKRKKRIGRGGKRGTYSGRGQKGQSARAGAKPKPMERELILRIPKKRGLGFVRPKTFTRSLAVLALDQVAKRCANEAVISPRVLVRAGLVALHRGRMPRVKIIGSAKLAKGLILQGCIVSQSAKAAVEAAGGVIKE